jgi:hypothetical protein
MPDVYDEAAFSAVKKQREEERSEESHLPSGVRVGGAIMLIDGIAQLSLQTIESLTASVGAFIGPWTAGFDIVVGGVLLSGQSQVWRWAIVRLVLGGMIFPILHLFRGRGYDASLQILFSVGLLLMMTAKAGLARRFAGAIGAGASIVLALCAAGPMLGWFNPFGYTTGRLNGEIAAEATSELVGARVGYRLDLSSGRWHVLTDGDENGQTEEPAQGAIQELSPAVRRPDALLDVRLFAIQSLQEQALNHDEIIVRLVEEARDGLPELLVIEDAWQSGAGGSTRVLEGNARIEGHRVGVALGFKGDGRCIFMLIGTAPPRMYPRVREDLLTVFTSLTSRGC